MFTFILLLVLNGFSSPALSGALDYYVTPTPPPNPGCPIGKPCYTVNYYAHHSQEFFPNNLNVSMFLLDGSHILTVDFVIEGLAYLNITGSVNGTERRASLEVQSSPPVLFSLYGVHQLRIEHMVLLQSTHGTCLHSNAMKLSLKKCLITNCNVALLMADFITLSQTKSGKPSILNTTELSFVDTDFERANIQFVDFITSNSFPNDPSNVFNASAETQHRTFSSKSNITVGVLFILERCKLLQSTTMGLTVLLAKPTVLNISIEKTVIANNSKEGVILIVAETVVHATINETTISENQGGGFILLGSKQTNVDVVFSGCNVTSNEQGGVLVGVDVLSMSIVSTNFEKNVNTAGNVLRGIATSNLAVACSSSNSQLRVNNVTFNNNRDFSLRGSNFFVSGCNEVIFEGNNNFVNNIGTPVQLFLSDILILGKLSFINNAGDQGGGLSLFYSQMFFYNNTFIMYEDNFAFDTGGALFVQQVPTIDINNYCFYQLPELSVDNPFLNIQVNLTSNVAVNGGEEIFGAAINSDCKVSRNNPQVQSYQIYNKIFHFDSSGNESLSPVSSAPSRVCLCGNDHTLPMCTSMPYIFSTHDAVYPGEQFSLFAVVVGAEFGTVSASVYANLLPRADSDSSLMFNHYSQFILYNRCTEITYSVSSLPLSTEVLVLTASISNIIRYGNKHYVETLIQDYNKNSIITSSSDLLSLPIFVNISIEPCPLGFSLSDHPTYMCECDAVLTQIGIKHCVILNHIGVVYRRGSIWVGVSGENQSLAAYCPYSYCKTENISINLREPDSQCTANRSGILCGACSGELSLALGSSRCIQCSDNSYVALIIPILIGYVLLVFFIKILDLTVTKGTISGLIFYANVVWANQSILFENLEDNRALYYIVNFIAWLNLDNGIETCFIKGLDAYGKQWFLFGQDFFLIIVIAASIYFTSRYSILVTWILGNNSVSVLATLFFLSYVKLLDNIVKTVSVSVLHHSNYTETRWALDANLQYFGPKHSVLFSVALLAFFVLWLPYTIILLFTPCLRKISHLHPLRWIDRQKPFFDAHFSPLKDKQHYWFGLLLLARGFLMLVSIPTPLLFSNFSIFAIALVSTFLILHPYQYKNWFLALLEKSFFLNLVILSCSLMIMKLNSATTAVGPVVFTSVCIALLQFVGIVLYHSFMAIRKCCGDKCIRKRNQVEPRHNQSARGYQALDNSNSLQRNIISNENSRFREPLLETSSTY